MTNIVILGWGSLIWDPRGLPIDGDWQKGGPTLRIEFSRISRDPHDPRDCRLTLVICEKESDDDEEQGADVVVRYCKSTRTDLRDAICDLRHREGTKYENIGFVDLEIDSDSGHGGYTKTIKEWALKEGFDAVVWTALPGNFEKEIHKKYSIDVAVAFFKSLPASAKKSAAEYFEKAPEEVDTPLLRRMVELGFIKRTGS